MTLFQLANCSSQVNCRLSSATWTRSPLELKNVRISGTLYLIMYKFKIPAFKPDWWLRVELQNEM